MYLIPYPCSHTKSICNIKILYSHVNAQPTNQPIHVSFHTKHNIFYNIVLYALRSKSINHVSNQVIKSIMLSISLILEDYRSSDKSLSLKLKVLAYARLQSGSTGRFCAFSAERDYSRSRVELVA